MKKILLPDEIRSQVRRSLKHLKYSFEKVQRIKFENFEHLKEEELEVLESFASRFARCSDIVIQQFLRMKVLEVDSGFRGSILDLLNEAEKMNWIESAKIWMRIRELRNIAAHEYAADDAVKLYQELLNLTPHILDIESQA